MGGNNLKDAKTDCKGWLLHFNPPSEKWLFWMCVMSTLWGFLDLGCVNSGIIFRSLFCEANLTFNTGFCRHNTYYSWNYICIIILFPISALLQRKAIRREANSMPFLLKLRQREDILVFKSKNKLGQHYLQCLLGILFHYCSTGFEFHYITKTCTDSTSNKCHYHQMIIPRT